MSDPHPLKEWRDQNGVRQDELAARAGLKAPSHISQIENDDRTPSLDLAHKLSEITGIPIEKFAGRSKSEAAA